MITDLGKAINPEAAKVKLEQAQCAATFPPSATSPKAWIKSGHVSWVSTDTYHLKRCDWVPTELVMLWEISGWSILGNGETNRGQPFRSHSWYPYVGMGQLCYYCCSAWMPLCNYNTNKFYFNRLETVSPFSQILC